MATRGDVARWAGAPERGTAGVQEITGVSAIEAAQPTTCVFATKPEALDAALDSPAGAILVTAALETERPEASRDPRVLWVGDARYCFAVVAERLRNREGLGRIDPSAIIAADAEIGEDTVVDAGAVIGAGVRVGARCRIGAHVCVLQGTLLGDEVVIQPGAVLGSDGFGYVRNRETGAYLQFPQQGWLILEDGVEVGANTTIDRGALGETRIGAGTKIDNLVHIGHNCRIGRNVIIAAQTGIAGSSVVEDGAVLGGQVGIADHVTVGPGVILGAQAGVPSGKRIRGEGQVFWGTPARPIEEYLRDLAKLRRL